MYTSSFFIALLIICSESSVSTVSLYFAVILKLNDLHAKVRSDRPIKGKDLNVTITPMYRSPALPELAVLPTANNSTRVTETHVNQLQRGCQLCGLQHVISFAYHGY